MFDPSEFISRYAGATVDYGTDDCGLWLADWWLECHGVDPASDLRGTYASDSEKRAIVVRGGGLAMLVDGIAKNAGAPETFDPQNGDFGVIAPGVCAIRADGYWVARADEGLTMISDATVWRAWSIRK